MNQGTGRKGSGNLPWDVRLGEEYHGPEAEGELRFVIDVLKEVIERLPEPILLVLNAEDDRFERIRIEVDTGDGMTAGTWDSRTLRVLDVRFFNRPQLIWLIVHELAHAYLDRIGCWFFRGVTEEGGAWFGVSSLDEPRLAASAFSLSNDKRITKHWKLRERMTEAVAFSWGFAYEFVRNYSLQELFDDAGEEGLLSDILLEATQRVIDEMRRDEYEEEDEDEDEDEG